MKRAGVFLAIAMSPTCLLLAGCGSQETFGHEEAENISLNIMALADAAENPTAFERLFAPGKTPEDRQAYAVRVYKVDEAADISGNQATVQVAIAGGSAGSANEGAKQNKNQNATSASVSVEEVVVQWTLEKIGDEWKIVDAPLQ